MYFNTKLICPVLKQFSKVHSKRDFITKVSSILFLDKPFQFLAFREKKKFLSILVFYWLITQSLLAPNATILAWRKKRISSVDNICGLNWELLTCITQIYDNSKVKKIKPWWIYPFALVEVELFEYRFFFHPSELFLQAANLCS